MEQKITCSNGHYLGTAFGTTIAELKCHKSQCKDEPKTQVKIVTTDRSEDLRFKFAKKDLQKA